MRDGTYLYLWFWEKCLEHWGQRRERRGRFLEMSVGLSRLSQEALWVDGEEEADDEGMGGTGWRDEERDSKYAERMESDAENVWGVHGKASK